MQGDRERCLAGGMDGYLPKPVTAADLYDVLESTVGLSAKAGSSTASSSDRVPEESIADPGPFGDPVFDPAEALVVVAGDRRLLSEMVRLFCAESPRMLSVIRKSVSDHDAKGLSRAAHLLRGSVGNFGKSESFRLAGVLEQSGIAGATDGAGATFLSLELAIARLERQLLEVCE